MFRTLITQVAQQSAGACEVLEKYLMRGDDLGLGPRNSEERGQGPGASLNMEALGELLQLVSQRFERAPTSDHSSMYLTAYLALK